ncbi:ABC transporter ATP-binding protein [Catenulispora sp. NL8]|uniref:ABC transporter ATP-binding protein n=1 Tax=Catenulispora pinistramenti TaxID=2705254 RepID=A0ABS5KRJ4_9ACTN|nr:ABC transporter ATP-binding protein [Catenulispora pinistramenti]MBS2548666.1 ABC transporter ATP-binding protein [Catenulispora pinistramenti]
MDTETLPASAPSLIRAALLSRRRDLAMACLLYSTHQLGESLVPVVVGAAIAAAADGGLSTTAPWLAVLAADFALLSLSYRFGARASQRAKQYAAHEVRMLVVDRAVRAGGGVEPPPGALLTLAGSDAARIGAFAGICASGLAAVVALVVATALLMGFSPVLGAVVLVCVTVLLLAIGKASDRLRAGYRSEQQGSANAATLAEDIVRGLRVLRGIGAERAAADAYTAASRSALNAAARTARMESSLTGLRTLATGAYLMAVAGVGGWLALGGRLSLGHLVSALGLAQFLTGSLQTLFGLGPARARAIASAERILDLVRTPVGVSEPPEPVLDAPDASNADLQFRAAVGRSGTALDFTVQPGRITGLVVDDTRAAADVPALLAREYDPVRGEVRLGGRPLRDYDLDTLRSTVLVALHDAALFPGTVRGNLGAPGPGPGPGAAEAARTATADQVISTLPEGWDTVLGEGTRSVSGGQRQRLALARALAARPAVLVLHDPTTAVDSATEAVIADNLRRYRENQTTLIVTTSPALLSRCDRVVFCGSKGTTAADSTHDELVASLDAYRAVVVR